MKKTMSCENARFSARQFMKKFTEYYFTFQKYNKNIDALIRDRQKGFLFKYKNCLILNTYCFICKSLRLLKHYRSHLGLMDNSEQHGRVYFY